MLRNSHPGISKKLQHQELYGFSTVASNGSNVINTG
jgi:hypothetical protein